MWRRTGLSLKLPGQFMSTTIGRGDIMKKGGAGFDTSIRSDHRIASLEAAKMDPTRLSNKKKLPDHYALGSTDEYCPTCHAVIPQGQMKKHLISARHIGGLRKNDSLQDLGNAMFQQKLNREENRRSCAPPRNFRNSSSSVRARRPSLPTDFKSLIAEARSERQAEEAARRQEERTSDARNQTNFVPEQVDWN